MTSILIVEDHPAFAQAVTRLLRNRYDAETVATAEEAVERIRDSRVDLVIVDLSLPGRNGIWLLSAIRDLKPGLPCLTLSGFDSKIYVDQSLEAGARGYVLKEDLPGLLDGIQAALNGDTYISEALRGK